MSQNLFDFLSIMSRCNYFHCCTRVFDELKGVTFREGGHFIWMFFWCIFKPTEGNTPAVYHQLWQLWAQFRTDLGRTKANGNGNWSIIENVHFNSFSGLMTSLPELTFAGSFLGVFLVLLASSSSELEEKLAQLPFLPSWLRWGICFFPLTRIRPFSSCNESHWNKWLH